MDVRLFEAAEMLGCSGSRLFRAVVLPAALPSIFNGLRLGLGFAWILIVVGEMTGVPEGLGAVIMDGRTLSRTELVITGMIVIGIAGFHLRSHRRDAQQPPPALEPAASCLKHRAAASVDAACCASTASDKTFAARTATVEALRDIDITIEKGEFVCLIGASGCGKSTLLRIIAGFEKATRGSVAVYGAESTGPAPTAAWCFRTTRCFPG